MPRKSKKTKIYEEPVIDALPVSTLTYHPPILTEDTPPVSPIPVLPQLGVALGLLIFTFGVTYIGTTGIQKEQTSLDVRVETLPAQTNIQKQNKEDAFKGVVLEAQSAVVWDVQEQRVLFNKNADVQRPLASITKLMTALVAYELLDENERVSISAEAIREDGDSGFSIGERFTVRNLTDLTLITSSNDGAAALGSKAGAVIDTTADPEAIFVTAMNVKAEELGLTKTYFKNSTGLDLSETEAGAFGSARDIAHLMEYVITNMAEAVMLTSTDTTTVKNTSGEYHTAKNTNPVTDELSGLIASKTGYTTLSGGNLVIAQNVGLNHPIIIVVLGSSYDGRFTDTIELAKRTKEYVSVVSE